MFMFSQPVPTQRTTPEINESLLTGCLETLTGGEPGHLLSPGSTVVKSGAASREACPSPGLRCTSFIDRDRTSIFSWEVLSLLLCSKSAEREVQTAFLQACLTG